MKRDGDLASYVELLARKHGGIEGLRNVVRTRLPERRAGGLEAAGGDADTKERAVRALEDMERGRDPGPNAPTAQAVGAFGQHSASTEEGR